MSAQQPIPSGFGSTTTAQEAIGNIRLDGRVAIVTGGYAGIGVETTRVLTRAGARVIVPARDLSKAHAALEGIANVTVHEMDLAKPATIDAFAARVREPVHLLINNAGIMAVPLSRDGRGLESQLAVNHVGHFQLFLRLLERLRAAKGARVLALSSRGHVRSEFHFEDPSFERRPYDKMVAYGQSKTANILFAFEADRRFREDGIRAFSIHPGAILETQLARHYEPEELKAVVERAKAIGSMKTIEQGAATTIFAATSPMLEGKGGVYLVDCDIAKIGDGDHDVRGYAIDPDNAKRLWRWSEEQLGS
jgi:NAD(P)-dependent dehydrogenase (short-subunit alcohol dehydrogenase family)